jgi:hypothetical protein
LEPRFLLVTHLTHAKDLCEQRYWSTYLSDSADGWKRSLSITPHTTQASVSKRLGSSHFARAALDFRSYFLDSLDLAAFNLVSADRGGFTAVPPNSVNIDVSISLECIIGLFDGDGSAADGGGARAK